jgi:hypothetical protein
VADPTGAIVPNAEIELLDTNGTVAASFHSGEDGTFKVVPPHAGNFTLVVSEPGFETIKTPVSLAAPAAAASSAASPARFAAVLRITLPIAALSTNVRVTADANEDLTAPEDNHDSSVMTSQELKSLPIFDNDYATAMSAFLDDSATATGGSGLIVDGVEANRATVSALPCKRSASTRTPIPRNIIGRVAVRWRSLAARLPTTITDSLIFSFATQP